MIRVGIIGCGRILNAHLQGFLQLRAHGYHDFRITALVARNEADAWMFHTRGQGPPPRPPVSSATSGDPLGAPHTYVSDFQDDAPVHVYTDHRRLLDDRSADALLDTTPVFLHHRVGLDALDAGLHMLTQKPLAVTVRAAKKLVERAAEKRRTLAVFENARYRPLIRGVRWAFEIGLLGEPQMALVGSLGGRWSPDCVVAETPWRHQKLQAGGGGSIDIGVHHMDQLRYAFGEVRSVLAVARTFEPERQVKRSDGTTGERVRANVDDTYFATVAFEKEAIAQLLWSWAGRGDALEIPGAPAFYGSRGCVQGGQLILADGWRGSLAERFEKEMSPEWRERCQPLGLRDTFAVPQWQWLEAIKTGTQPETSGDEGVRDLAAAYAILESAMAGRAVSLGEVLDGSADAYQREIDEHYGLKC